MMTPLQSHGEVEIEIRASYALMRLREMLSCAADLSKSDDPASAAAGARAVLATHEAIRTVETIALRPVDPRYAKQTVELATAKDTLLRAFDPYRETAQRYSETVNPGEYTTALYNRLVSQLKKLRSDVVAAHDDFVRKVRDQ